MKETSHNRGRREGSNLLKPTAFTVRTTTGFNCRPLPYNRHIALSIMTLFTLVKATSPKLDPYKAAATIGDVVEPFSTWEGTYGESVSSVNGQSVPPLFFQPLITPPNYADRS
jgi:hypothetical protein